MASNYAAFRLIYNDEFGRTQAFAGVTVKVRTSANNYASDVATLTSDGNGNIIAGTLCPSCVVVASKCVSVSSSRCCVSNQVPAFRVQCVPHVKMFRRLDPPIQPASFCACLSLAALAVERRATGLRDALDDPVAAGRDARLTLAAIDLEAVLEIKKVAVAMKDG